VESAEELLKRIREKRRRQYEEDCVRAKFEGCRRPVKPSNLEPEIRFIDAEFKIPDSWLWLSLEDIASTRKYSMSSGPFGSALGTKDYIEKGVPVIRGQNIQNGKFVLKNFVYVSDEKASELERSTAYPDDVVVVAVGSSGQAAVIPDDLPRSILSQNCNKTTLDEDIALSNFCVFHLQNEIARSQLREKTTDTARPFLSLTNLKQTLLPLPPLSEQAEIVQRVEGLFKIADGIEERYKKAKGYVNKLAQAILAKAFRGELVTQDPNDEPASVLLERIREERDKKADKSQAGKTKNHRRQRQLGMDI
jgi:type I restriction enzyme S subunit